jgi:hypothetical protein
MVSHDEFCIFSTEDGSLYANGTSAKGLLGLGIGQSNTDQSAIKVLTHLTN